MDASPIQSGSKCGGSDFSIERILGDRKDTRAESVEVPEWLCCTRYRPPRLPRAATVCRSRRAGRHARVPFTAAQAAALEAAYARSPYLAPPALRALAAALQLRDDRIKIWFQNRRARERREKCTTIAPPQAVTLPPTTMNGAFSPNTWLPLPNLSSTRRADTYMNAQRFITPVSFSESASALTNNHDLADPKRFKVPPTCVERFEENNLVLNYDSREVDEDRPGTPLDIETVED